MTIPGLKLVEDKNFHSIMEKRRVENDWLMVKGFANAYYGPKAVYVTVETSHNSDDEGGTYESTDDVTISDDVNMDMQWDFSRPGWKSLLKIDDETFALLNSNQSHEEQIYILGVSQADGSPFHKPSTELGTGIRTLDILDEEPEKPKKKHKEREEYQEFIDRVNESLGEIFCDVECESEDRSFDLRQKPPHIKLFYLEE